MPGGLRALVAAVALLGGASQAAAQPVATPAPAAAEAPSGGAAPASGVLGLPISVAEAAALVLSGVAVLIAGAALGVAGSGRRRLTAAAEAAEVAARRPAAPPAALAGRVERLEATVRDIAAAAVAREPQAAPPAPSLHHQPFPPPVGPRVSSTSTSGAHPPIPIPPAFADTGELAGWSDGLTQAFARLARDPPSAAADFIARWRPRAATATPDGIALLDGFEGAKLWAVRASGDGEVWALVPGEQAVLDWSAHFAPRRTQVATEVFGEAFDLVADGAEALRMEAPALLRRDASGRLSVRRRGRLAGFRG